MFCDVLDIADGKIAPEELSEEDQQLKSELDMLVERITVRATAVLCKTRRC